MNTLPPDVVRYVAQFLSETEYLKFSETSKNILHCLTYCGTKNGRLRNVRKELVGKLKGYISSANSGILKERINNIPAEVQLIVLGMDGCLIKYIKEPSEIQKLTAVTSDDDSIKYIYDPSEKIKLMSVQTNGYSIRHIKNPSKEIQIAAVIQNWTTILYIEQPDSKTRDLYEKLKDN